MRDQLGIDIATFEAKACGSTNRHFFASAETYSPRAAHLSAQHLTAAG
jgi:hypothetical protein